MNEWIQIDLRKSHVNGATKVKLYSYIGICKYLGFFQNFSARGVQERKALSTPLLSRKLLELES